MGELVGHFHPVLVHLPIGVLLLACLLQWLSNKPKYSAARPAISLSLFIGMIGAILSCITGWLLSGSDDYESSLVNKHQWLGIGVAVFSVLLYLLHRSSASSKLRNIIAGVVVILIILTGHFGGSLTHGSDYLFVRRDGGVQKEVLVPNVQEALVYDHLVEPLLEQRCYSCHGRNKQKGGLRMDTPDHLMRGGENGDVIISGEPGKSELIRRLNLPRNHDDHMPPKEKPQLNEREIALLHWWIQSGASFDKRVAELSQPEKIKSILVSFQRSSQPELPDIPEQEIEPADSRVVSRLSNAGVVVLPISQNSNYLMANFVTATHLPSDSFQLLVPLRKHLVWLKLSNTAIDDSTLKVVGECENLRRLYLDNTLITDSGLTQLRNLKSLTYLNLVGTRVTAQGIAKLQPLKNLTAIYLYRTAVGENDMTQLGKLFPKVYLDTGGYAVPVLPSDTTELKTNAY